MVGEGDKALHLLHRESRNQSPAPNFATREAQFLRIIYVHQASSKHLTHILPSSSTLQPEKADFIPVLQMTGSGLQEVK